VASAHDDDFLGAGSFGLEAGAGLHDLFGLTNNGDEIVRFDVVGALGYNEVFAAADASESDTFRQFEFE